MNKERQIKIGFERGKICPSTKKDGGRWGGHGVRGSSSNLAHLQLSQIISAREVRGGKMSKYLNKLLRSLLRVGRCGERGIVGANGVERVGGIRWGVGGGWMYHQGELHVKYPSQASGST